MADLYRRPRRVGSREPRVRLGVDLGTTPLGNMLGSGGVSAVSAAGGAGALRRERGGGAVSAS